MLRYFVASRRFLTRACVSLGCIIGAAASAAPPDITSLYPASGQQGQTVKFNAVGTFPTWPVEVDVDRPGVKVTAAKKSGEFEAILEKDAPPGIYWLRMHDTEGAAGTRPFIVGTIPEIVESKANRKSSTDVIELPATPVVVNALLAERGEVDQYRVSLKAGQTLIASVASERPFGSPMDAQLQLASPLGFVVVQNLDHRGMDPQIEYKTKKDGVYTIRVSALPVPPNTAIDYAGGPDYVYRLTVTTGPFLDHARPMAIEQGSTKPVGLAGWQVPADANFLPAWSTITGAEGVNVLDARLPLAPNAVPLQVVKYPAIVETRAAATDVLDLAPPVAVTGEIGTPGEIDTYRITAKKGDRWQLRLDARALDSPLDAVLEVLDSTGKSLLRQDDQGLVRDAKLEFRAAVDGQYLVTVQDLFRRGGWRFVYVLHAHVPPPDVEMTVTAESFTMGVEKPFQIPVTIKRPGITDDVTISAEGLPAGVTCEPVVSQAKGDSSKSVTLTLTAKEPVRGSFQIVARGKSLPTPGEATAARKIVGETTTRLWVTASKSVTATMPPTAGKKKK